MPPPVSSHAPPAPLMVFHLRQAARIALTTGALTLLCLGGAILHLFGGEPQSYGQVLQSFALGQRHLIPALLLSGLLLVAVAGMLMGIISLYSTFRVAGPLFRFSRCIQRQIQEGPLPMAALRDGDLLQEEYHLLAGCAENLQAYYDAMSELVDLAQVQLELPDPDLGGGLTATLTRLKELERLVRL